MTQRKILPYFSEILNDNMYSEIKSNRRLVDGLTGIVPISMRNVQRYRTGEQVPKYEVAKAILEFLKIDIQEDELRSILINSKVSSSDLRKNRHLNESGLHINPNRINLGIALDNITLNEILLERVHEVYGESGTVNQYVSDLIELDLNEHIL